MTADATTAWDALEEPWRVCLALSWRAYGAGTIPVGAALVDGGGAVVAEGRNRVYEPTGPEGQIANSLLAHAEVNALVGLDPERRYEEHVLYTALEPCLLCVGATVMATVGRVRYAGATRTTAATAAWSAATRTSSACRCSSRAARRRVRRARLGAPARVLPPPQPARRGRRRLRGAHAGRARRRARCSTPARPSGPRPASRCTRRCRGSGARSRGRPGAWRTEASVAD